MKFRSMALTVTIIVSHKEECMYHFMLEKKTLYITQSYTQCCHYLNSRATLKLKNNKSEKACREQHFMCIHSATVPVSFLYTIAKVISAQQI